MQTKPIRALVVCQANVLIWSLLLLMAPLDAKKLARNFAALRCRAPCQNKLAAQFQDLAQIVRYVLSLFFQAFPLSFEFIFIQYIFG